MLFAYESPDSVQVFVSYGGATLILFAIVSGFFTFAVWTGKRLDKRIATIAEQLDKRTQPIQSGYRNDGNSLTDVSLQVGTVMARQADIGREIGDLREANEAQHEVLSMKVAQVAARLDEHAASPAHNQRTRSTDPKE